MPPPLNHPPYQGCENGGRPAKYTPEFIEAEADALEKWMQDPGSLYFKRFAFDRGYSQQRLSEFAEVNDKFSETLVRAREWQEIRLAEGAMKEELNPGFCKFLMTNLCGFAEKTETKVSGDAANPLGFVLQNVDGKTKELVNDK
jgi:hypothetical protein